MNGDVMALTYVLSSTTEEDVMQYTDWLLHKDAQARIRAHNWLVASKRESAFVDVHGATIEQMPWPLFPPTELFHTLNSRLLANELC